MTRAYPVLFGSLLAVLAFVTVPHDRPAIATTREIVAVFVGATSCCRALTPSLRPQLESLRLLLAARAREEGAEFRMVGVSIDWDAQAGWDYLRPLGHFDEVSVGSNWRNLQSETLIWRDRTAEPVVPQLVVYRHQIESDREAMSFSPRERLKVLKGVPEITEWVRAGATIR